jgi:hypothetical protein
MKFYFFVLLSLLMILPYGVFAQLKYSVSKQNKAIVITSGGREYKFKGDFTVIYCTDDPSLEMRPAGIKSVSYNVPTWKAFAGKSDLNQTKTSEAVGGDGLDDKILRSDQKGRTVSITNSGRNFTLKPISITVKKDTVKFRYAEQEFFSLTSFVVLNKINNPRFSFVLKPHISGYFSVGYSGAPEFDSKLVAELWQPLIWQEKRFPDYPYVTSAHMCTLPATLINDGINSIGVLVAPEHLPFNPLPLLTNSQFGVAVRDENGKAKSQVFAPLMGGLNSKMTKTSVFKFNFFLVVDSQPITYTFENISRTYFGFRDYRKNDISNLNHVIDNMMEYVQTKYAWYVDSLKGFSYSTDVPGAVKNVSSLNPLDLAIVTDNEKLFKSRAYPLMEFMLSRENFLFALDSSQKIQSPSRKLNGQVASVSELTALYNVFNKSNPFLLNMASLKASATTQGLPAIQFKRKWTDAMLLYKATGDKEYLQKAVEGANIYLKARVDVKQEQFNKGNFFWPRFVNQWVDLFMLYELTGNNIYLNAAREGARYNVMFAYMSPLVPDSMITVNPGGKAPYYWYLESKGHKEMSYPEEQAPAWRLSEIGLTPESSGTSSGHRAIFMATYAPWMLKVGYHTNDSYLKEVAKAAIIGRYRNFPGYHINTARTTAYEKIDFPLHDHKDQSVNSFHYNHIMPMATMLLDYLVSDAYVRSNGKIEFPGEYVEGYAYLQNKIYGAGRGTFYGEKDVRLWMPAKLLDINNVELNYISARKSDQLYLSFTNQSDKEVTTNIRLNQNLVILSNTSEIIGLDIKLESNKLENHEFTITVPANGIASVKINGLLVTGNFQDRILSASLGEGKDYLEIKEGNTKAMLIRMGNYSNSLFVYLEDDDSKWTKAQLNYTDAEGNKQTILKKEYPFEFTVPLNLRSSVAFSLELTSKSGVLVKTEIHKLGE